MKNKIFIVILSILFLLFSLCSIIGLLQHRKNMTSNNKEETQNITYEYYLEDIRVPQMPQNTNVTTFSDSIEENQYIFKRYNCTNNVTLDFDENAWKVNANGNNALCKLYFVNAKYNVTFTVINGLEDQNNNNIVNRESDGKFKIIPNEGYEFKEIVCANNKGASWNDENNIVEINAITSDIACTIKFEKKEFLINVTVKNGIGTTTEKALYGDSKLMVIEPNSGYNNPTIKCTNEQVAVYNNNSLTFDKITNDTSCIVTFNKIALQTYAITIENLTEFTANNNIIVTSGSQKNIVNQGENFTLTISSPVDKNVILNCGDIIPNINNTQGAREFTFREVNKNITCKFEIE